MTAITLEPCPFCGEAAHFVHSTYDDDINGPIRNWVRVECASCEVTYGDVAHNIESWGKKSPDYEATRANAEAAEAARWNRRAALCQPAEEGGV